MDTLQTNDLTEEEGLKAIEKCLNSMRDRFVISQSSFTIKIVRKDGIRVVREAVKPEGAFWLLNKPIRYVSILSMSFLRLEACEYWYFLD